MVAGCCCCRRRRGRFPTTAALLVLFSAVPVALITSLERSSPVLAYRGRGWLHDSAKWDPSARRFLVSTFLGASVAEIPDDGAAVPKERVVVADPDVAGNMSLGIVVDPPRRRLLVVYADGLGFRAGAVAAYDLDSWARIFLTRLSGPDDEASLADDVAVDEQGTAYVTDAKANKLWKVGVDGELLSVIRSDIFVQRKGWLHNFVGLNGIIYHPGGYLLVVHTSGGHLFKIDTMTEDISLIEVKGSLLRGDGLELLSPTKLVVAGTPTRVVESSDGWVTAKVTGRYIGPVHRVPISATVRDGRVYLNHLFGFGLSTRTFLLAEAIFTPVDD